MLMTSPQNKHPDTNLEAGVTLLLSVLLLASITTIAFSLAAVGFAELSSSDDLSSTEPIFYSSLGVAEEAIFGIKRKVPNLEYIDKNNCNAWKTMTSSAGPKVSTMLRSCLRSTNNQAELEIPISAKNLDTGLKLYLFDPDNGGAGGGGYEKIIILNSSKTEVVSLTIKDFNDSPPLVSDYAMAPGAGYNLGGSPILDVLKSYEITLWSNHIDPNSGAFVNVTTNPKGLPYLNKRGVEIESSAGRLIRRLQVLVPTQ